MTIWNDGRASLSFWRTVFERRAPSSIDAVERIVSKAIGQGNTTRKISDELLDALTQAYRTAASAPIPLSTGSAGVEGETLRTE